MENCTKFGQLILSKIIKIVATSCQILRLEDKTHQIRFRLGRSRNGSGAATGLNLDLRGPTSKGRAGKDREGERAGEGRRKGEGKGGEGRGGDYCLGSLSA